MFGDEVERLYYLHPLTGEVVREVRELFVFPASHYVAGPDRMERAIRGIEAELEQRLAELERQGQLLEAPQLRLRTTRTEGNTSEIQARPYFVYPLLLVNKISPTQLRRIV